MNDAATADANVINAAFAMILAQDWAALEDLHGRYPGMVPSPWADYVSTRGTYMRGQRGVATWNKEGTAYAVEAGNEPFARWMGFGAGQEEGLEVTWLGTRQTARGTWVAQFTVWEE